MLFLLLPFWSRFIIPMSPIEFQRLVDGELNHDQRAEMLRGFGEDVRAWRSLALSLLEEQQWSREIATTSKPSSTSPLTERASIETALSLGFETPHDVEIDSSSQLPNSGTGIGSVSVSPNRTPLSWNWMSALAASLLFAFGLFGGSWMRSRQEFPRPSAGPSITATNPEKDGKIQLASESNGQLDSPTRLRYSDIDQQSHEIPLVDSREFNPQIVMAKEAYDAARLRQQFKRRGYHVDVQPEYYTGNLDDGRKVIVPVQNVSLKPNGL
jgi:hypothetical protein